MDSCRRQPSLSLRSPLLEIFSRGVTIVSEKPSVRSCTQIGWEFSDYGHDRIVIREPRICRGFGIEPRVFLETINSALVSIALLSELWQDHARSASTRRWEPSRSAKRTSACSMRLLNLPGYDAFGGYL